MVIFLQQPSTVCLVLKPCKNLLDIWYAYRKSNAGIPGVWVYKLGYGAAIEEPNPDIIAEEPGK